MYVSRGPNKIATSARRGLTKPLDNLENRDTEKQNGGPINMSSPKPTFHHTQNHMNGNRKVQRMNSGPQEPLFQQHEELVHYLNDAWSKVSRELEHQKENQRTPILYKEKQPNPLLSGFKPFDLEHYWGQRKLEECGVQNSS